jgi:hypothetical protein
MAEGEEKYESHDQRRWALLPETLKSRKPSAAKFATSVGTEEEEPCKAEKQEDSKQPLIFTMGIQREYWRTDQPHLETKPFERLKVMHMQRQESEPLLTEAFCFARGRSEHKLIYNIN